MGRDPRIGREVLHEERASANYRFRRVRTRRTGEETWEVLDVESHRAVLVGLADREEALRAVKGLERVGQENPDAVPGKVLLH